jgi:hypothetical protein
VRSLNRLKSWSYGVEVASSTVGEVVAGDAGGEGSIVLAL